MNFQRQATKQNESAHQYTLTTDVHKKTRAVQDVFDQSQRAASTSRLMSIGDAVEALNIVKADVDIARRRRAAAGAAYTDAAQLPKKGAKKGARRR